ncbi:MAG TPA: hypothetical protein PKO06_01130 [Candidatus Ozemobacteraceae bacterium]|nr:hypothetical protein [Candidatus Ozemobacteraceae bacterium]
MAWKQPEVWFGLLGAAVVSACLLLRMNVRGMTTRGPGWWRRLLVAGLSVLGLSVTPAMTVAEEPQIVSDEPQKQEERIDMQKLAEHAEGKKLLDVWKTAEDIASGKKGHFPFAQAEKEQLLKDLAAAETLIDELAKKGCYRQEEGELLKVELRTLVKGVQKMRPTELQQATCYKPMMLVPAVDALDRLETRLPLLEKLGSGTLSPAVAEKLARSIRTDLKMLKNPLPDYYRPTTDPRPRIEAMLKRLPEILEKMGVKPDEK